MKAISQASLISDDFFNVLGAKRVLMNQEEILDEISELFYVSRESITSLSYKEKETREYIETARVYLIKKGNILYKIRYSPNKKEAVSLFRRSYFAYKKGFSGCKPIRRTGNYVLFFFLRGKNITTSMNVKIIGKVALIQSAMNKMRFSKVINQKLENRIKSSIKKWLALLVSKKIGHKNQIKRLEERLRVVPQIIACFDHQDFGAHNLILRKGKVSLIDEEAFSILPLGYGVVRPVFDRVRYRIMSKKNLQKYLSFFRYKESHYIRDNISFFRALFVLRNSIRRWSIGNKAGARKLLGEL